MTSVSSGERQRWARVADLFEQALAQGTQDRAAWLDTMCGTDTALRDDVLSLLRAHERAASFIDKPATLPPREPAHLAVPSEPIGHYHVVRVIGAGGMGVVYLADDTRLGRRVALKMVAPQAAQDQLRTERLRREARAAAALSHPGIATVFALEEIEGRLYMASEYVPGHTLREELDRGPLPLELAVSTVTMIGDALAVAHARGIVHRDLKPENIVRTANGMVKVLDFGLALTLGDQAAMPLTGDGAVLGTPGYMSPEQIRGHAVDARSDQFALGVLLYELVSGAHPFRGPTPAATLARILEANPPALRPPAPADAALDDAFDRINAIVARSLRKYPDERYDDVSAFTAALTRLNAREPAPVAPPPPHRSPQAMWWWQFHQAAVALGYALLLLPVWRVRDVAGAGPGILLFLVALVAAVLAGGLRLHLWFAIRQYPDEWLEQHRLARRWVRGADIVFCGVLLVAGLLAARLDDPSAALLVAAATSVAVTFIVVEPATTRAALGRR